MQTTLLEMTQEILSGMDSDEVNSLNDTIEAASVAKVIKRAYKSIATKNDLVAAKTLFQFDSSTDIDFPTHVTKPDYIHSIEWVKYDVRESDSVPNIYKEVYWMDPEEFLYHAQANTDSPYRKEVILDSGVKIWVWNSRAPTYYTSFDDHTFIFDAYNINIEDTIQTSKTAGYGQRTLDLVVDDLTVIDLPEHLMDALYSKAEAMCWSKWKDNIPDEIKKERAYNEVRLQRLRDVNRRSTQHKVGAPNYGRK